LTTLSRENTFNRGAKRGDKVGITAQAVNFLWRVSCFGANRAFKRDLAHVQPCQDKLLMKMLEKNRDTVFGRKYGFKGIRNTADYQKTVPLSVYEDYEEYLDDLAKGKKNVLTAGSVLLFEPTGGSTKGPKYIPYTREAKAQFNTAIEAWIWDLSGEFPGAMRGRAYWSISPALNTIKEKLGKIRVGFEEDAEYLGPMSKLISRHVMAVPAEVSRIKDIAVFKHITLLFLLKTSDLSMISVWNPTFLQLILAELNGGREEILN
jgi:hypothetical protein